MGLLFVLHVIIHVWLAKEDLVCVHNVLQIKKEIIMQEPLKVVLVHIFIKMLVHLFVVNIFVPLVQLQEIFVLLAMMLQV